MFGLLRWVDSDMFSIEAKAETDITQVPTSVLLQSILEDRFQLKVHHETRQLPAYHLVVAKNGPKLQPPKQSDVTPWVGGGGGRIRATNANLGQLSLILRARLA